MSKITIIVDESGTLPDPKDKVIIMAAVGVDVLKVLLDVARKAREKIKFKKKEKRISEIKFYRAGERTKTIYLKELSKKEIDVFVLVVNKNNQKIPDTPEHFAFLSYLLIEECLLFYRNKNIEKIIFDKHFHKEEDRDKFNKRLLKLLDKKIRLLHLDSQENPEINSADMIAGSLLWKYSNKSDKFYKTIRNRIISEKILNWKEARRKFFNKTKNLTNRRKRPSREDL